MTRPQRAGINMGNALVEMINLHYIDKGCLAMLYAIKSVITAEINRRQLNGGRHHTSKTRPKKKTSTNKGMKKPL